MLIVLLQCCFSFVVVCCASVIYNQRYQPYRDTNVQQYQDYYYQDFPHQTDDYGSITTAPLEEFSHDIDDVTDLNNKFPGFLNEAEDKHAEYNKFLLKHRKNKFKKRFKKRRRYCKPPHKFRRFRKPSRADFVIYDNINNVKLIPFSVDTENNQPKYRETPTYPSRTYVFSDGDGYYGNSNRRQWNSNKEQSFASKDEKLTDSYPSSTANSRKESFTQLKRQKRKNFSRSHSHKVQIPENMENSRLAHDDSDIKATNNIKTSSKTEREKNIKGKMSLNKHEINYNDSFTVYSKPWRHSALNILNSFNAEGSNIKSTNETRRNQFSLLNALNGHMNVISDKNDVIVGNKTKNYKKKFIPNEMFATAVNEDDFYPIVGYRVKKESSPYSSNRPIKSPKKNLFDSKENVVIVTPIATLDVSPSRSQESKGEYSTNQTEVIGDQQTGRISNNDENESSRQSQLRRIKSLQFNKNDMSPMNSLPDFSDSDSNILSKGWRPMIFTEEQDQEMSTDHDFSESSVTETHPDGGVVLEGSETSRHDILRFDPEDTTSARRITIADRDLKTEEDYTKLLEKIQPYILKKSWINKLSDDLSTVVSSHIVVQ